VAPRRVAQGFETSRLAMILAVLQRRAKVRLTAADVYMSTVGGARLADPAVDLAVAVAVASAARDVAAPRVVALGEVGLAGDLRPVPDVERRLAEAARLGVVQALVPAGSLSQSAHNHHRRLATVQSVKLKPELPEMSVVEVASLSDALAHLGLGPRTSRSVEFGQGASQDVNSESPVDVTDVAELDQLPEPFGPRLRWGAVRA
jgi:DNA repair protein RadA/Sms